MKCTDCSRCVYHLQAHELLEGCPGQTGSSVVGVSSSFAVPATLRRPPIACWVAAGSLAAQGKHMHHGGICLNETSFTGRVTIGLTPFCTSRDGHQQLANCPKLHNKRRSSCFFVAHTTTRTAKAGWNVSTGRVVHLAESFAEELGEADAREDEGPHAD